MEELLAEEEDEQQQAMGLSLSDHPTSSNGSDKNAPQNQNKSNTNSSGSGGLDGSFTNRQLLVDFGTERRGIDGMDMDRHGNIYATADKGENAGVYVFSPSMKLLDIIPVPDIPTNCTFACPTLLYITAQVSPKTEDNPAKFGLFRIAIK